MSSSTGPGNTDPRHIDYLDNNQSAAFEYGWRWFQLHADQRLRGLQFFMTYIGATVAAYAILLTRTLWAGSAAIAAAGALVSAAFIALEVRNHQLMDVARQYLRLFETDGADFAFIHKTERSPLTKHVLWIRLIMGVAFLACIAGAITAALLR